MAGATSDAALIAALGLKGPAWLAALEEARATEEPREEAAVWRDVGDALGEAGRWDRAVEAWERGTRLRAGPGLQAELRWRLGQLAEARGDLEAAAEAFERAAEAFERDGAHADEAVAWLATVRVTARRDGAGASARWARNAVAAARASGEDALVAASLEAVGEAAVGRGHFEDAAASFLDSVRYFTDAHEEEGVVRATIALAEARYHAGDRLGAVAALEPVAGRLEIQESLETRGRGMALIGLAQLEVGAEAEATEYLTQGLTWLEAAQATGRRAELLATMGRFMARHRRLDEAKALFLQAWTLAREAGGHRVRLAPLAHDLARCLIDLGEGIDADAVIEEALRLVQESGDLDGLAHCTALGVRIAVGLHQGKLATERLLMLGRARARLGDEVGALRTFRDTLVAVLEVPDSDPEAIAQELMDGVRRLGSGAWTIEESNELIGVLGKAGRPDLAHEVTRMEIERAMAAGLHERACTLLVSAAVWAAHAGDEDAAIAAWDEAIALGGPLGLPDVAMWERERMLAGEGRGR